MQIIGLIAFRVLVFVFRFMPFALLYLLSDGISWVLGELIGYRKKVVEENLVKSFPGMSKEERKRLVKRFYKHLADILLEGIKGMSMSQKELEKRFRFTNPEILDEDYAKGQHVFIMPAHYGNWEWAVLSFSLHVKHDVIGVYKPLRAPMIEDFVAKCRSRFGLILNPISKTREAMNNPPERTSLYIMMSDQHPSSRKRAQWVRFLGRDTACLHGADYYSRKLNYPVYFMHINRVKRGYYDVEMRTLHLEHKLTKETEITQLYMAALEEKLLEKPEDWLWSHRRWKYGKE